MSLIGLCVALPMPAGVGVATSSVFSPLALSPTLWLDASDATTITESGGAVSQWDDKSGNGYNLQQGTGTAQPATGTRTINSLNVIDFDGTSDWMDTSSSIELSQPNTVFVVYRTDTVAAGAYWLFDRKFGGAGDHNVALDGNLGRYNVFGGSTAFGGSLDTNPHILRFVFNGASSSFFDNGAEVLGTANLGTADMSLLTIGQRDTFGSYLNGAYAEIVVVNGLLSADQISDTETYLTNKWIPIPIQLNATAWFDASNTFSITESSGSVSQWDDLSGNGYHLTQGTGTAQPTTGTRTINSLNVLDFDGSDYLTNTSITTTQPNSIFAVVRFDTTSSYRWLLDGITSRQILYQYNGEANINAGTEVRSTSTPISAGTTHIWSGTFDGASSDLRIDGVSEASGNAGTNGLTDLVVGTWNSLNNYFLNGAVAEVFMLDNPAPADVATAESYLAEKWGVTLQEFSPLDLSPTLWLDASDTSTITESGGSVSQWDDKSTNNHDLTQATGTKQPATGTRTINSLNVIDFDGSSDYMQVTYGSSISQPLTIFAVAQNDDPPAANVLWAGITTLANAQLYLAGTVTAHWINGGDPTLSYGTAPDGNLNIYRVAYNGASTSLAINGDVKVTGTTGTHSPTGFTIGASTTGSAPFDGVIGEAIVVEGAMTAQQIYDTENYLANKWGITL